MHSDYEAIKNEIAEYLKNIDSFQVSEASSTPRKKANSGLGTREIDPSDLEGGWEKLKKWFKNITQKERK